MSLKEVACREIDANAADLNTLSQEIWKHPELAYEETFAHDYITGYLEKCGFDVQRRYNLPTAFRAEYGESGPGPNVAVICEYDALPGIGHACGHNLIAEVGVAAGLGIKAALQAAGKPIGKVTVLGTPAEESMGGKIDLINAGVFKDIDVAMMAHPTPETAEYMPALARQKCFIKFHGKASHAAGFPWNGINALDAAVLCYQNVSCLRQQMKPDWRVHGVIHNGGVKPNIIPELTEMEFNCRAPTDNEVKELTKKFSACVEAAATATGCKADYYFHPKAYESLITNQILATSYKEHAMSLGLEFSPTERVRGKYVGSTDMGNVSHVVPSIHPMFFVGRKNCINHTTEFTEAAGSSDAQPYTLKVSKALAMTGVELLLQPSLTQEAKRDLLADVQSS
ncbi:xaa-Arg dipeptidase-like [Haliotis cracherodii]|uniref:xaa-Arg dipeptidase-like n=1 Tax=Haliotis cracherodii TaxID=6455 RepID=UPI0039E7FD7C